MFEKAVLGMALLRIMSGSIEVFAALMMLKVNQVEKAMMINGSLALVGPLVLILTTSIGLVGIADKVSFTKIMWILLGVAFILIGVKSR
ncbi:YqhV family protein [Ammoniphilus oxalaticus]|uniref:YqhV family protein n=1 Tax=Ammoniphilus oxalaticus TaxID=66863 RepID=UPI003CCC8015